jgi:hypothetical protein
MKFDKYDAKFESLMIHEFHEFFFLYRINGNIYSFQKKSNHNLQHDIFYMKTFCIKLDKYAWCKLNFSYLLFYIITTLYIVYI